MTAKQVDILNLLLIIVSLLVAFYLPFQLFLFSYAVLGPLHYLTEIHWLNKKNFFVADKQWVIVLLIASVIMFIPIMLLLPLFTWLYNMYFVKQIILTMARCHTILLLLSLIFAAVLVLLKKATNYFFWLIAGIVVSALVLKFVPFAYVLFGIFLPTIIHVYLFTLLFMIYGALSIKTTWGIANIIGLIICPIIIILWPINAVNYLLSDATKVIFAESGFNRLAIYLAKLFGNNLQRPLLNLSVIGIKVQIFIAFCYTYHYLNWFSKTSVIGWGKQIATFNALAIIVIWLFAVALYWHNYALGFKVLAFLSILHVLLEFPLNIISIKAIVSKVFS